VSNGPPGLCKAELQNTLTHELGHLHGLEDTCQGAGDPPRTDNLGNPVPDCASVLAAPQLPANMKILDSTMYRLQDCGETKKESLSPDDIQAMCDIYPVRSDPPLCAPVGSTGAPVKPDDGGCGRCSASGSKGLDGPVFLAGTIVLLLLRRRRDRQAGR
jgi:hypothetical protein